MTRTEFKRNINSSMKRIADELVYMMQLIDHVGEQGVANEQPMVAQQMLLDIDAIISDLGDAYNAALFSLSGIE